MGRTKKILLIALSSLMAAQAPAMAGELVVEDEALLIEEAVHEETGVMLGSLLRQNRQAFQI